MSAQEDIPMLWWIVDFTIIGLLANGLPIVWEWWSLRRRSKSR